MTRLKSAIVSPTNERSVSPKPYLNFTDDQKGFQFDKNGNLQIPTPRTPKTVSLPDISKPKSKIFPSTRFFMAILLCLCFVSLAVSTSNISVAMVCMTNKITESKEKVDVEIQRIKRSINETDFNDLMASTINDTEYRHDTSNMSKCALAKFRKRAIDLMVEYGQHVNESEIRSSTMSMESCSMKKVQWTSTDQGMIFAAQNIGSLFMLVTGTQADRLNGKWTIVISMALLIISNASLPFLSFYSFPLTLIARVLTGLSDALLQPSTSSMITRWFPPKERPFAIGLITGGRQIGTLLVLPVAGILCEQRTLFGGWPAIFYFSAIVCSAITLAWILLSADKPSKHFCIKNRECNHIEQKIKEENLGKRKHRKKAPWGEIVRCVPLYAGVAALVCHEWPLVIILQLLPKYLSDVLKFNTVTNGFVSSLPICVLFISKTFSSSLSSYLSSNKRSRHACRTKMTKAFNFVGSLGLGLSLGAVPFVNDAVIPIILLCLANAFAGLHTPGVQTALLQIAPAYTGIVTGIAFGVVAIFSVFNKILSSYITTNCSSSEWNIVFWMSSVIAILPCFFFTIWGSADRQSWASSIRKKSSGVRHKVSTVTRKTNLTPGPERSDMDRPFGYGNGEKGYGEKSLEAGFSGLENGFGLETFANPANSLDVPNGQARPYSNLDRPYSNLDRPYSDLDSQYGQNRPRFGSLDRPFKPAPLDLTRMESNDSEEGSDEAIEEENIASALRMRMFFSNDDCSTEEETLSHSSGSEAGDWSQKDKDVQRF
ncbi:unnamed protein product [Bursaphelenchus okinawaensis]|uniref:Major facilitator superfamily (MFS) profile domain-containing protein n=1 Tax=Bursaphelenchus okinawaensis TaxID=465554 RepID=A0A811LJV0_9BILA|nr:unnamed protein product [Bursaphelenchus okinawaensis]CAG9123282.1 unnamed protein product [Bursaphelenchus okinawaensis]